MNRSEWDKAMERLVKLSGEERQATLECEQWVHGKARYRAYIGGKHVNFSKWHESAAAAIDELVFLLKEEGHETETD